MIVYVIGDFNELSCLRFLIAIIVTLDLIATFGFIIEQLKSTYYISYIFTQSFHGTICSGKLS